MKHLIGLLLLAMALSGCATPYDRDIAKSNNETVQNHDKQQANVVEKKTSAIERIFIAVARRCENENSFACGALLGMSSSMASRDIAGIKTEEYKGPVQKTGLDVQDNAVDKAGAGIPIFGMATVSIKAIDKDKGVVSNTAQEGSTVNNSYDEDHATGISTGEGSVTPTNAPSGDHTELPAEGKLPVE